MSLRVLVTGGRVFSNVEQAQANVQHVEQDSYPPIGAYTTVLRVLELAKKQRDFVWKSLSGLHALAAEGFVQYAGGIPESMKQLMGLRGPIQRIIHGGAEGVDMCAKEWAQDKNVCQVEIFVNTAAWARHGKRAGNNRNIRMLMDHSPELVVAFPGETGTHDCVAQARTMGIRVWEPKLPADLLGETP